MFLIAEFSVPFLVVVHLLLAVGLVFLLVKDNIRSVWHRHVRPQAVSFTFLPMDVMPVQMNRWP